MSLTKKLCLFVLLPLIVTLAALSAFVHFYLTDQRIKALVIPVAEKNLGRTVAIGDIGVGLFSGITINDFAIKEHGGGSDFITAEAFVLSYNLMALLRKELKISELRLRRPTIRIVRNKDGAFNFSSLAILAPKEETGAKEKKTTPASTAAIPLALTVQSVAIEEARLFVEDKQGTIPTTQVVADLKVALALGGDLADFDYTGELDLKADLNHGTLTPHAELTASFDRTQLSYTIDLSVDGEQLTVAGQVEEYLHAPQIECNISSKKLHIDKILALAGSLPAPEDEKVPTEPQPQAVQPAGPSKPIAQSIPAGLTAHGTVSVQEAVYTTMTLTDFLLLYDLRQGILIVKELSGATAGGAITSNLKADLNQVAPAFEGSVGLDAIQVDQLGRQLGQNFMEMTTGSMAGTLNFQGAGATGEAIKKTLTADAAWSLANGSIQSTETSRAVASLTGLQELDNITFSEMTGTAKLVEGGVLQVNSSMDSTHFKAASQGKVTLEGQLDLPITITLSEELSGKLDRTGTVGRFLGNDSGQTELDIRVSGTSSDPQTRIEMTKVQEQVGESLKKYGMEGLQKILGNGTEGSDSGGEEPANILKGLFGR